jgi:hypothetical protein
MLWGYVMDRWRRQIAILCLTPLTGTALAQGNQSPLYVSSLLVQSKRPENPPSRNSNTSTQPSMTVLMKLATEQIRIDTAFLGKRRFSFNPQSRVLSYDLNSVPSNLVLSSGDKYADALEALVRVESLRRDFHATIPNEKFWLAPLESIQRAIERCVQDLEISTNNGSTASREECSHNIDQQFEKLRVLIATYAVAHHLRVAESPNLREAAPGYQVHVEIEPPTARLRVMTLLEFKKCQYLKISTEQCRWNEFLDTESKMIGWYHYRAEWPPELNGPEEGDFEIRKASTITFKPKPK